MEPHVFSNLVILVLVSVGIAAGVRLRRSRPWREAGARGHVGSMLLQSASVDALRLMAEELL